MKRSIFFFLGLLLLNACAAPKLDQNFSYSASSQNAMIAVLDYRIKPTALAVIRSVNMENGELYGRAIILGDNKTTKTPAYHLKEIPPGKYVIAQIIVTSRLPFSTHTLYKCYRPTLEVFEVEAGKVNAVKVGKLEPGNSRPAPDLEKILRSFGGITAPVGQAKLLGYLSTKNLADGQCENMRRGNYKFEVLKLKPGTDA
ncbi:hypothetical protein GQF03_07645 [Sneathiella chungangensis]|uniref:DUF2846 domain-containing protein n=1 Tax=Sneathiella chungangensis TaxID=1418234 RepID=A0A845MDZ3_9PROT|nr:hypothetical protein [Sneathiella chungangensis]MZR22198.1 hypothetical protein [Sneathiella chungangensis]